MKRADFIRELKIGLKETGRYVLSHHEPSEYYRCYRVKQKYVCARCAGIYIGLLLGMFAWLFYGLANTNSVLVGIIVIFFPLPALIDWSYALFTKNKGSNIARSVSGVFLGAAYSIAVFSFFAHFPNYYVLLIGAFYIGVASLLVSECHKITS
jgi:uncharacterized membrane protein